MGSLIAIFFALGIGILIGGSLGQKWMFQTEQHTLSVLMNKYERQLEENQKLHKDKNELQLMHKSLTPLFKDKRILWVRPHTLHNDLLTQMMISTGVDWVETESDNWLEEVEAQSVTAEPRQVDMVIISDPEQLELITQLYKQLKEGDQDGYTEKAISTPEGIDHHTSVE